VRALQKPEMSSGDSRLSATVEAARLSLEESSSRWLTSLSPWNRIVEVARDAFGTHWATIHLACTAAGIRSSTERCTEFSDLFDDTVSLCGRVRYARFRAGQPAWWEKQVDRAATDTQRRILTAAAVRWASPRTLIALGVRFVSLLDALSDDDWHSLLRVGRANSLDVSYAADSYVLLDATHELPAQNVRLASVLYIKNVSRPDIEGILLSGEIDVAIADLLHQRALSMVSRGRNWDLACELLRKSFAAGASSEPFTHHTLIRRNAVEAMPIHIAQNILDNAAEYPAFAVGIAQQRWRDVISDKLQPVASVARVQGWGSFLPES